MNLTIEIPDEFAPSLIAKAEAHGVSPDRFVSSILQESLQAQAQLELPNQPFETGFGALAKYGAAPSADEIDANRREMFRNFAQDH